MIETYICKECDSENSSICCDEIVLVEKINRDVNVTLSTGVTITLKRKSIKEIMTGLTENEFEMIHSGAIVNLRYVQGCENDRVKVNNQILFLSRRHKKAFKEALIEYIKKG